VRSLRTNVSNASGGGETPGRGDRPVDEDRDPPGGTMMIGAGGGRTIYEIGLPSGDALLAARTVHETGGSRSAVASSRPSIAAGDDGYGHYTPNRRAFGPPPRMCPPATLPPRAPRTAGVVPRWTVTVTAGACSECGDRLNRWANAEIEYVVSSICCDECIRRSRPGTKEQTLQCVGGARRLSMEFKGRPLARFFRELANYTVLFPPRNHAVVSRIVAYFSSDEGRLPDSCTSCRDGA